MEEDRKEENREHRIGGEGESSDRSDDLTEEIHKLVEAMTRAARNVWSSEQRLQLEEDLRRGLGSLVGNLEDALDRFSRSEQGQEFQEQANRVADRVRESELASELKEGLTVGLRSAADEVRKFADGFEEQQEKQEQAGAAQDIPVESANDERREEST